MVLLEATEGMDSARSLDLILVEDHPAVRMGVDAILRRAGHRVAAATGSAEEAYGLTVRLRPDVVLLDVALSDDDGIELARSLLSAVPEQKIMLYTGFAEDRRLGEALSFGVGGVALKAGTPQELVDAVQTVAADGVYLDPRLRQVLGKAAGARSHNALSKREAEVFELLAKGFTGEEIANRLVLSAETVRTHVRNGMRRLGARTRAHAVAMALSTREIQG